MANTPDVYLTWVSGKLQQYLDLSGLSPEDQKIIERNELVLRNHGMDTDAALGHYHGQTLGFLASLYKENPSSPAIPRFQQAKPVFVAGIARAALLQADGTFVFEERGVSRLKLATLAYQASLTEWTDVNGVLKLDEAAKALYAEPLLNSDVRIG